MRQEKTLLLDQIKEHLNNSDAFVVFKYQNLDANSEANLRNQVAQTGGKLMTLKKRLLVKASEQLGVELNEEQLQGHVSVLSTGENVVDAIKSLYKFKEEKENTLDVLVGKYEGALCTAQDVEAISKLPSKDEMRAQILGVLEAVPAGTLGAMDALLTSVVYCLENKINQTNEEAS